MDDFELEKRLKLLQAVDFFSPFSMDELAEVLKCGAIKKYAAMSM